MKNDSDDYISLPYSCPPSKEKLIDEIARKPAGWKATRYILANTCFERLASNGLAANFMVYFGREYHMDQVQAATILNTFFAAINFMPIIGAFVSDTFIGKFWTITFGSFASLLGMLIMMMTAMLPMLRPPPCTQEQQQLSQCAVSNNTQIGFLVLGLVWIAIGAGGIRPCSIPFSMDQFDLSTEEGRRGTNGFFSMYYTTQTIVMLIATTLVVYVQESVSWTLGFAIPAFLMVCAIILFFVGKKIYVFVKPEGSMFSGILRVFVAAYNKRHYMLSPDGKTDVTLYDPPTYGNTQSKLSLTNQFRLLNKAAIVEACDVKPDGSCSNQWRLSSIQQVEEVKCLVKVLTIWIFTNIGFITVAQQSTFTVSQALKMDRHIGSKFEIPAGSVCIMSLITIGTWLPFYDRFIMPALEKVTKNEGGITLLQKIALGQFFAVLTMIFSGLMETKRRGLANLEGEQISVLWLAPQQILVGLCEMYLMVGLGEFCNKEFPDSMRSIGNSLQFLTSTVASYLSNVIINIVSDTTGKNGQPQWLTDDVNTSRLDYFYFLLAGLIALNFVFFMFFANRYHYKSNVKKYSP
ncbi:putative Nitrate transporter 1.7 [Tripterygium wilfordii]|uniref:Putative Nitrate transporter 1.7 n=2 Tax=Tripterygium wilfordii TaxID=458696 RepID=A0A7J7DKA4_TRIWF|nr:putative Nitrate transporter 1.7 [Tripterygium wilfordii]